MSRSAAPAPASADSLSHAGIFALAWPIILANATTPLTGIVDTAVIGQAGVAALLGAIALGALIFNFLYWGLGFLRMGTTGLTAQALGAGDETQLRAWLARAVLLAAVSGLALIALHPLLSDAAFALFDGSSAAEAAAARYLEVRIWGAPGILMVYAAMGWFIGLGDSRKVLILTIVLNVLNAGLDILLVAGFGMGVTGVAIGTALAEWASAGCAALLVMHTLKDRTVRHGGVALSRALVLKPDALARMFAVNRDIFIRTLLLIMGFAWFTADGARAGDVTLAANHVLLQFISFAAFFLDGFAFAAETLVGRAVGARDPAGLAAAVRRSTHLAALAAVGIGIGILILGPAIIHTLTTAPDVRAAANVFLVHAAVYPLVAVWAFQFDGIFIGATRGREMRNAMLAAFTLYLGTWWLLREPLGNHGLWLAFQVFAAARGLSMWALYPAVRAAAEPETRA